MYLNLNFNNHLTKTDTYKKCHYMFLKPKAVSPT